jgi:hypothetical protein
MTDLRGLKDFAGSSFVPIECAQEVREKKIMHHNGALILITDMAFDAICGF